MSEVKLTIYNNGYYIYLNNRAEITAAPSQPNNAVTVNTEGFFKHCKETFERIGYAIIEIKSLNLVTSKAFQRMYIELESQGESGVFIKKALSDRNSEEYLTFIKIFGDMEDGKYQLRFAFNNLLWKEHI